MNLSGVDNEEACGRSRVVVPAICEVAVAALDEAELEFLVPVAGDRSVHRCAPMRLQLRKVGWPPDIYYAALQACLHSPTLTKRMAARVPHSKSYNKLFAQAGRNASAARP
jgi:hypothetical protein